MRARLRLDQAEVIVSLDADFFGPGSRDVRAALDFSKQRRGENDMSRLYVVETMPSLTGAMADHRRAARPSEIEKIARRLADAVREPTGGRDAWIGAVARDLKS